VAAPHPGDYARAVQQPLCMTRPCNQVELMGFSVAAMRASSWHGHV
jgi:hypothetical protein